MEGQKEKANQTYLDKQHTLCSKSLIRGHSGLICVPTAFGVQSLHITHGLFLEKILHSAYCFPHQMLLLLTPSKSWGLYCNLGVTFKASHSPVPGFMHGIWHCSLHFLNSADCWILGASPHKPTACLQTSSIFLKLQWPLEYLSAMSR